MIKMADKIRNIGSWLWLDLEETQSTNDAVDRWCQECGQPCVVTAKRQTAGRGRRGRSWISQEGNLFMSFAFPASLECIGQIAVLSGLIVLRTVRSFCSEAGLKVKWPNDVLADGGKISGILFERAANGFWIMGIGINVVSNPLKSAAGYQTMSINALGVCADRLEVFNRFVAKWDDAFKIYQANGFDTIKKQWLDNAYNLGKTIVVRQGNAEICGIFAGLDDDGALLLDTDGKVKKILAGDVMLNNN